MHGKCLIPSAHQLITIKVVENGKPDTFLELDRESKLPLYEVEFFQRSVKLSVLSHGKSFS